MNGETADLVVELHLELVRRNPQQRLILIGDHNQLPPIWGKPMHKAGKFADFAIFLLQDIVRQPAGSLMRRVLENLASGERTTDETVDFVKGKVNAPAPSPTVTSLLWSATTREEVKEYNDAEMAKLSGPEKMYVAEDTGNAAVLERTNLLESVTLKAGAQAMLTVNVDVKGGLVNGLICRAKTLNDSSVTVQLKNGREVEIGRVQREVIDWYSQEKLGSRLQLPLAPASSVSLHKLQSQTCRAPYHIDLRKWDCWRDPCDRRSFLVVGLSRASDPSLVSIQLPHPGNRSGTWSATALRKVLDAGLKERSALVKLMQSLNQIKDTAA